MSYERKAKKSNAGKSKNSKKSLGGIGSRRRAGVEDVGCNHKADRLFVYIGGKAYRNLNVKGYQIIMCSKCNKFGHLEDEKEVWT